MNTKSGNINRREDENINNNNHHSYGSNERINTNDH